MTPRRRFLSTAAAWAVAGRGRAVETPLRVVASFSILADLVRNAAGDHAAVESLVGADSDAHVFEPTPSDVRRLARAELVVVNGLGFEGWIDRLIRSSGYRGRVVTATDTVARRRLYGHVDPHAWQDLSNGIRYVRTVRAALVEMRPGSAEAIASISAAYIERLETLDRAIRERFATIPRVDRRVISSHDAFGYFGSAYGIDFLSPLGFSTGGEPSAATIAALIRQIRAQGARAVFVENMTDARLIGRVAQEAGVTVGGRLYSDALTPHGTAADTYLKLVAHNASTIATALNDVRRAMS